ncbi:MAG: dihydrodipicolinate synthase family protein [Halanaeroarchaeum sp.]
MALPDSGLIVPPMTPFEADGTVDETAYESQIEYVVESGSASSVALMAVEAQEYRCLSVEERRRAIERGAAAVDGRLPLVVGVSAPSYRRSIELASVAESVGADAIQALVPARPQGGTTHVEELVAYYEELGAAVDLPIVAYHNPGPGAALDPEGLRAIAAVDAVAGFKESSRNLRHVLRLVETVDRAGLANYYTTMEMTLITALLGGSGATMPAPASIVGQGILDAVEDGDIERATALQRQFAAFPGPFLEHGFPVVMKAALEHVGVDAGRPCPPAEPLPDPVRADLARALDAMDL